MTEDASSIPRFMVCPYCGSMHKDHLPEICEHCHGRLDPESREHTRADLVHGLCEAWIDLFAGYAVRDPRSANGIGADPLDRCGSWADHESILDGGPESSGLSHHFGLCHACQAPASAEDEGCRACGVSFGSRLIATAWDLAVMVLRLRLWGHRKCSFDAPAICIAV